MSEAQITKSSPNQKNAKKLHAFRLLAVIMQFFLYLLGLQTILKTLNFIGII